MTNDTGRPEMFFCNGWRPKADQYSHELRLTDFFSNYRDADAVRGWLVNRRLRPDAEMTLDGCFYFVELDTGEQTHSQVQKRQAKYAGVTDYLLYVTLSEKRRAGLLRNMHQAVRTIAMVTTLAEVMANPRGEIWQDYEGELDSI